MVKNNYLKFVFVIFGLLFMINSVYSASWYDASCWFNDQPVLDVNIINYDEDGNLIGNFHLNEDNNAEYTLTEGDIIKFDFSGTTDDENNIRSERIFWLSDNTPSMNIQSNSVVTTTTSSSSFSSNTFDFYEYLLTGQSKEQHFQENTQLISYNDGDAQTHFVKTFKPKAGEYEVLFRIKDDCADADGSDEVYKFITISVSPKEYINPLDTNVDDFNRADSSSLGIASNGNTWWEDDFNGGFNIANGVFTISAVDSGGGMIFPQSTLELGYDNPTYFSFDVKFDTLSGGNTLYIYPYKDNMGSQYVPNYITDGVYSNQYQQNIYTITDTNWHTIEWKNINPSTGEADIYVDDTFIVNLQVVYPLYFGDILITTMWGNDNSGQFVSIDNLEIDVLPENFCSGTMNITNSYSDYYITNSCDMISFQETGSYNIYTQGVSNGKTIIVDGSGVRNSGGGDIYLDFYNTNKIVLDGWEDTITSSLDTCAGCRNNNYIVNMNNNEVDLTTFFGSTYITNGNSFITNQWANGQFTYTGKNYIYGMSYTNFLGDTSNSIYKNDNRDTLIYVDENVEQSYNTIGSDTYNIDLRFYANDNLDKNFNFHNNYIKNLDRVIYAGVDGIYLNVFELENPSSFFVTVFQDMTIGKSLNGVMVGNAYLDQSGNDVFTCPSSLNTIQYGDNSYKVCSTPVEIYYDEFGSGSSIYDYIIVTDENSGGITIPIDPNNNETLPNNPLNQKPVAVLDINNNEVEVGQSICWDISGSYDTDGTIVKKTLWEDNVAYTSTNTRCITKNSAQSITLQLEVEDNDGDTDTETKYIRWTNTADICDLNTPTELNISYSQYQDNLYYLNMTTNDVDGDNLDYAWTVNGEVVKGQNVLTSIDYSQYIFGAVDDGCNITSDFFYIDVGQNFTDPIEDIEVNLVCSQNGFFAPTTVNCEVVYDVKDNILKNITWIYDNVIISENSGVSFYSRNVGDTQEHMITTTITTNEGKSKSDYYRFNLVTKIGDSGGDDSGGGGGTSKDVCDINLPDEITIDENNLVVPIIISNDDTISWSPDYKFEDILFHDSSADDLKITNIIGTIQADETKEIGVAYTWDNINPINSKNKMIFTSANCEDIEVIVNVEIGNSTSFIEFGDITPLLSELSPSSLLNATVLKKELIGDNETLGNLKIWQLSGVLALLFTIILWKWTPFKGTKRKPKTKQNIITKSSIVLVLTIFFTIVLIKAIEWLVGIF